MNQDPDPKSALRFDLRGERLPATSGAGTAWVHSTHIADLVSGANLTFAMKYKYAVGSKSCNLRLYQTVGGVLTQIGTAKSLTQTAWTAISFTFTALATAALQARLEFVTGSVEGDELRVDQFSIKPT